jgi:hypothetical protein
MVTILKTGEVTTVQMVVEASSRDAFVGTVVQSGGLPHTFSYGTSHTLRHQCVRCAQEVTVEFAYGKQILAGGPLSRQGFHENRELLDAVGQLFDQYLYQHIDGNGFESYLYLSAPHNAGALRNVAYYRCPKCQAQYLLLYNDWLKDNRPPFEPDDTHLVKLYQVEFEHDAFLQAFNRLLVEPAG